MRFPPIIIGGFYRSGTSLLRRLLDVHSQIHCSPEIKFFKDFYGDYLHDDLEHVRFFSTLRTMGLKEDELLKIFGGAFILSHEEAALKLGKRGWADKNPENVLYLEQWYHLLNGRFFFVHVVRHPLDALASLIETKFEKTIPPDFESKILLYIHFIECGLDFSIKYPKLSYQVDYESLVTSPEITLKNLLKFLGLKYEPAMLTNFNNSQRQQGIEDPKIKFTQTIHSDSIGRWEKDLSKEQIKLAKSLMSNIADKLGYEF